MHPTFLAAFLLAGTAAGEADVLKSADLQWKEMVPGVVFAPAYGDWEQGAHGKYVRIARGAEIPMHSHKGGYHATFISGKMVNILDEGTRVELAPGDHFHMAGGRLHSHECLSDEGCFFYTHSDSAWDIAVPE